MGGFVPSYEINSFGKILKLSWFALVFAPLFSSFLTGKQIIGVKSKEYKANINFVTDKYFSQNPRNLQGIQGHKQNNGIFIAENLTVKCPSKYITEQEKNEISPPYQEEKLKKQI